MAASTADILIRARDEASKKLGNIGRSAQSMASMLRTAAVGAAGYLSARAILGFAKSSVEAFQKQQNAVEGLNAALGLLSKEYQSAEMQQYAAELQKLTTVGDETTLEMMTLGVNIAGMSGDTLKQATVSAIGLSKAFRIDLNTAMKMVARAAVGDTGILKRYGIVLDENVSASDRFNQLLEIGRQKFALAEAETQTFSGRIAQLSNAWGDAKEQLGKYIAETPALTGVMDVAKTALENVGLTAKIAWDSSRLALIDYWEDIKHFFGTAIPAYLNYFRENWKNVLTNVWEFWKAWMGNIWVNYKNFFMALYSWMKGDGFNFEWTGLLTGFESTLEAMKPIAERQATEIEKILQKRLEENVTKFVAAGAKKVLDTSGMGRADYSGTEKTAAEKRGSVALVESRFLSGATTGPNYEQETAANTKRQIGLLERIAEKLETKNQTPLNQISELAAAEFA